MGFGASDKPHDTAHLHLGRGFCLQRTWVLQAVKYKAQVEMVRYSPYTMPVIKMAFRFQELGVGLAITLSFDRAIMAPSLKTASSTMSRVGKYLHTV